MVGSRVRATMTVPIVAGLVSRHRSRLGDRGAGHGGSDGGAAQSDARRRQRRSQGGGGCGVADRQVDDQRRWCSGQTRAEKDDQGGGRPG